MKKDKKVNKEVVFKKNSKFILKLMKFIIVQGLLIILISIYFIFYTNKFENIKQVLIETAMTTQHHQYYVKLFLSDEEIKKYMKKEEIKVVGKTEVSKVKISSKISNYIIEYDPYITNEKIIKKEDGITIIDVSDKKFKGYLMIIYDPSRISLGIGDIGKHGNYIDDIVKNENAIAGINAGGFIDIGGKGNGGTPIGIVVKNGEFIYGGENENKVYEVIGFTKNNIFITGNFSVSEMRRIDIKDAISFRPALVINGMPQIKKGSGGWGLAPRTAIGQRQDGTVLMLVIDGRQVNSVGATLKDLQDIMLKYGAYNAANLDGGGSTIMYYKGEFINKHYNYYRGRRLPTAFVVK